MFRANVVVPQLQGLTERQLEDTLGSRSEGDVAFHRLLTLTDQLGDCESRVLELDARHLHGFCGNAVALVNQAKQEMLGSDVVVLQPACFFLRKDDDATSSVSKPFKHGNPPGMVWPVVRRARSDVCDLCSA